MKTSEQFVMHRRSMLESCSWRVLSLETRQLLDRIEIEHLHRGGQHNGELVVSYAAFTEHGMPHNTRAIAQAIKNAEALGLLAVKRGGLGNRGRGITNQYRLTYLPTADRDPTDDWRAIESIEDAKTRLAAMKIQRKPSAWLKAGRMAKVVPFPA